MNKMKQGYQIPVRRIYRLSDSNKASEKDLNSARSGYSANNVLTKDVKGSKFSIAEPKTQDKENIIMSVPIDDKIPTRKPLIKR